MLYNTNHHNEINVRHLPEPLTGCGADCGNTEAALPIVGTDGTPNCIFTPMSIVRFCLTLLMLVSKCANGGDWDPWLSTIRKKISTLTSIK